MAQAWTTLGSKVTLVEGARRLLPREEEFACEQVTESLTALGVDIRCGASVTKVEREQDSFKVSIDNGSTVRGEHVLAALGRRASTAGLGLETVGIEVNRPLSVNDSMQVAGHDWLYAVGDVNGRVLLTHMGKYQARIAADHILGFDRTLHHGADGPLSPRVTFTEPQVAAVGHTLSSAQAAGLNVRAVDTGTSDNAGGSFYGRGALGTARVIIDQDRNVIVGATITGAEIADFIHAATIAIVGEISVDRLWHAVPCFPTRSELWLHLVTEL
jgi:dihydrolipoamide dehydrogenase